MEKEIEIALNFAQQRHKRNLKRKNQVRLAIRRQDDFSLVKQYQLSSVQHILRRMKQIRM